MLFTFMYQFIVFNINNWLDFIDVLVASYKSDDVVWIERHVFVWKVECVFASFNAHHAYFEFAAENRLFQLFPDYSAERADGHFLKMEVLLEHFWNDKRCLFLASVEVFHEAFLQMVVEFHYSVRESENYGTSYCYSNNCKNVYFYKMRDNQNDNHRSDKIP